MAFRGFCSAGTQGSKWGTGDEVTSAIDRHTASPSAGCQSWGAEEPMAELEKRLYKVSLIYCHLPSCAMTTAFPINRSYTHTWFPDTSLTTD